MADPPTTTNLDSLLLLEQMFHSAHESSCRGLGLSSHRGIPMTKSAPSWPLGDDVRSLVWLKHRGQQAVSHENHPAENTVLAGVLQRCCVPCCTVTCHFGVKCRTHVSLADKRPPGQCLPPELQPRRCLGSLCWPPGCRPWVSA